ncbi:MAG: AAA family ATPase [Desulfobacterales bacterium]|nr:AAA family ATPase [Desulfobacterales bacterium]
MISQIQIKNFQSHRETVLDLHEGVNALIGLTGAGKSVVFKALDWLFRNRPLGDEYRSWWGGDTQIEVVLEEGQKVGRIRKYNKDGEKTDDCYYIGKQEFRAFNKDVPQPVLDLLNLSEVNFQAQADPAFLISNSSGEVARYLNRAAHLDTIDQALSNISSTLRKEKEELGQSKKVFEQAQEQLLQYDWLPEANDRLVTLEDLQEKIGHLSIQKSGLTGILVDYGKTEDDLTRLKEVLKFELETKRLILLDQEIEKQNSQWEKLAAVIDQYEKAEKELRELAEIERLELKVKQLFVSSTEIGKQRIRTDTLESIIHLYGKTEEELSSYDRLPEIEKKWVTLDHLCTNVYGLRSNSESLKKIVQEIDNTTSAWDLAEKEKIKLGIEFNRLMPNICPLCEGTGGKK